MEELVANLLYTPGIRMVPPPIATPENAFEAGLDVLITTDHNVCVEEMDGYFS